MSQDYAGFSFAFAATAQEISWLRKAYTALKDLHTAICDEDASRAADLWGTTLKDVGEFSLDDATFECPTVEFDDARGKVYVYGEDIEVTCGWLCAFLAHHASDAEIFFDWACWCSRPVTDSFSGGLARVTRNGYRTINTSNEKIKELLRG